MAGLRALFESRRKAKGFSRNQLASIAASRSGQAIDERFVWRLEVTCRTPPDPAKLRAIAQVLGLTFEDVTGAIDLGMARW